MEKKHSLDDITSVIGMPYKLEGSKEDIRFSNAAAIDDADESSVVWIHPKKDIDIRGTKARILIVHTDFEIPNGEERVRCFIRVKNPRLAFIRVIEQYFPPARIQGVHPSAVIHPEAVVRSNTTVGPHCYVGKSIIGEGTILEGHCYIYDNVEIGKNVLIHAGTVIGGDGFGYAKNDEGQFEKFPHIGGVIIEDDVEIGANTCIDRGTLGNTLIKTRAKIDNLVHIAHNVVIGRDTVVIAHSQIAGSVVIGDNVWVAPSVTVSNVGTVGREAYLGIGSVVIRSVGENEKVFGNPARTIITPKGDTRE